MNGVGALFYSPVYFTDASDLNTLMQVWCIGEIKRWIKQRTLFNQLSHCEIVHVINCVLVELTVRFHHDLSAIRLQFIFLQKYKKKLTG